MALPNIVFNASTGSDTAASGAGPASAVTGTAAAHTNGSASTTITLTNSPDLSGVATDGSHCLWMDTASGRQFSKITGADDAANTVTVEDSFNIASASAVNYAIGGKRATFDNADSRLLFTADVKPGWTITTETDQTLTSALGPGTISGTTSGMITLKGDSATSIRIITQTANTVTFGTDAMWTLWVLENLCFKNSNGTKTSTCGVYSRGAVIFRNCIFGDPSNTNNIFNGLMRVGGSPYYTLERCEVCYCTDDGIDASSGRFIISDCFIHHNAGHGIDVDAMTVIESSVICNNGGDGIQFNSATDPLIVKHCTIHDNTGDGIDISGNVLTQGRIVNNQITSNAYGINANASQDLSGVLIDYNNFGTGGTANSSGSVAGVSLGANSTQVDPGYENAATYNFEIGTACKAAGFPDADNYIGTTSSGTVCLTKSYVDIGAAQREEPTVGGDGNDNIFSSFIR